MKYVSAYLMCVLGGNDTPSEDDVKGVLAAVGVEVDAEKLTSFMSSVAGKVRPCSSLDFVFSFSLRILPARRARFLFAI